MDWIKQIWEQITSLLHWWVTIQPWERGLRIWLGKETKILSPGIHFRIPYLHTVYVDSIRVCYINTCPQTISFKSGDPTKSKDVIENLMALCRECHIEYGDVPDKIEWLKEIHLKFIQK